MSQKRPSIIDTLDIAPEAEAEPATPAKPKVVKMRAPKAAPEAAPEGIEVHRTSIYVPLPAHERLREIAFVERKKVHDLIMEGIDAVIAKRGHSETAKRKPKAS
ncbi:hypothetical protein I8G32_05010 (plasmid) [Rhodopseudomonas palustris]|uniref:Uncharacterized protein n=1 Tax=Rhodopseudomonas palustris (strain ATCC BAA-98 / CGA009) TaxID=258594 RepID=A0ACD5B3C5_RHOPA|nr:hypothetical protein [Rhodopseudomonas palustris]OPF89575.1 hypothetical protein B1S06_25865 [Rhodopseudomonas palustris]QQM06423.1 hypothetical protein I8G32_05010 [Rhodopseudomonas palustris]RJF69535.1 hypothetical protein D4Q71_01280 [Rhodopseudomonas palustris]WAB80247.1 hypothetical protein OR798_25180 [Rhodopseudomonas palustris]WND54140.1 hypothetical protein L1A21_25090 [Rhodopseudomonas palustris]